MRPAFHHFFEEKYRSPDTWVEKTLTYTRSIATTSIAGYILGLGDRHLSNILIDEHTAEVVHIDFGIAFEQGKVLPLPETIPFRLLLISYYLFLNYLYAIVIILHFCVLSLS